MSQENCLIIAGEKSGEDHAMTFLPEMMKSHPQFKFYGVGGDRLQELGVDLLYHLKDFSGIGISEILSKIPFYFKALDHILDEVDKRQTKTAILIDFQGFNLKLAKKLNAKGVKVLYYVAPQAWVWKPWRAKTLQQNVHTLFTILPFEKSWFQRRGVTKVKGVVHPLMIEYKNKLPLQSKNTDWIKGSRPIRILLLPGSRNVEVSKLLPVFVATCKSLSHKYNLEFGIVTSESVNEEHYSQEELKLHKRWPSKDLREALNWADMSLAASGTVTLATGLFSLPTVVCYKVSFITKFILKLFITYKGPASLTNIVHDRIIFPEFFQNDVNVANLSMSLEKWIKNPELYIADSLELQQTRNKLTGDSFSVPQYMNQVIEESYGS